MQERTRAFRRANERKAKKKARRSWNESEAREDRRTHQMSRVCSGGKCQYIIEEEDDYQDDEE